jgi:N utilization substance protein B
MSSKSDTAKPDTANSDTEGAPKSSGARRGPGRSGARRTGGGSAKARRKAARLAAVQALYQIDLTGNNAESVLGEFIKHRIGQELDGETYVAADPKLFAEIVRGTSALRADVDGMVSSGLDPQWPLERLELLLRAILRAGAYELMSQHDIHPRIVINEYVDVCHAFFAGREPGMVNAVLDRLARTLRPDDLAMPDPDRAAGNR